MCCALNFSCRTNYALHRNSCGGLSRRSAGDCCLGVIRARLWYVKKNHLPKSELSATKTFIALHTEHHDVLWCFTSRSIIHTRKIVFKRSSNIDPKSAFAHDQNFHRAKKKKGVSTCFFYVFAIDLSNVSSSVLVCGATSDMCDCCSCFPPLYQCRGPGRSNTAVDRASVTKRATYSGREKLHLAQTVDSSV